MVNQIYGIFIDDNYWTLAVRRKMNEIKGIQNQIIIPEIKQQEITVVKKDDSISFGDTISNF